jgi:hypothetical protein
MEGCLRAIADGGPADGFAVAYSDMHGLWGGATMTLRGDGAYERAERPMGAPAPVVMRGAVGAAQVRAVAALLLEIAAWEQRAPVAERPLVPDESWATLEVRCGEAVARIAELHRDLGASRRIVRVFDLLRGLEAAP